MLRARRERPRRRAAEKRDELASSYLEHGLLPGTRCARYAGFPLPSLLIPAPLMRGPQRAPSLFTTAAGPCCPLFPSPEIPPPISTKRFRTLSSSNALSSAPLSLSSIGRGTP